MSSNIIKQYFKFKLGGKSCWSCVPQPTKDLHAKLFWGNKNMVAFFIIVYTDAGWRWFSRLVKGISLNISTFLVPIVYKTMGWNTI